MSNKTIHADSLKLTGELHVHILKKKKHHFGFGLPSDTVTQIAVEHLKKIWVSTKKWVAVLIASGWEKVDVPSDFYTGDYCRVYIDKQNRKWITDAFKGIYVLSDSLIDPANTIELSWPCMMVSG